MTLAARADAATTRDALAAAARLCSDECCVYVNTPNSATGADLRGLQPDLTPEPTLERYRAPGDEMTTPQRGDVVEVIRDTTKADYSEPKFRKGTRFVVDMFWPGFKPEDPEYGDDGYHQGAVVNGWANSGTVEIDAALVRVVTPKAAVKRPSADDVLSKVTLDDMDGDWFVHESGPEDEQTRYFLFTDRQTGTEWAALVRVVSVHEAD